MGSRKTASTRRSADIEGSRLGGGKVGGDPSGDAAATVDFYPYTLVLLLRRPTARVLVAQLPPHRGPVVLLAGCSDVRRFLRSGFHLRFIKPPVVTIPHGAHAPAAAVCPQPLPMQYTDDHQVGVGSPGRRYTAPRSGGQTPAPRHDVARTVRALGVPHSWPRFVDLILLFEPTVPGGEHHALTANATSVCQTAA
jgi:hypothetical protein